MPSSFYRPSLCQWALTVTECPGDAQRHVVMMKGAPEIVLTKCSHFFQVRNEAVRKIQGRGGAGTGAWGAWSGRYRGSSSSSWRACSHYFLVRRVGARIAGLASDRSEAGTKPMRQVRGRMRSSRGMRWIWVRDGHVSSGQCLGSGSSRSSNFSWLMNASNASRWGVERGLR